MSGHFSVLLSKLLSQNFIIIYQLCPSQWNIWAPWVSLTFEFALRWDIYILHDDVVTWRRFPRYLLFVRRISPHKGPVTRTAGVSFDVSFHKLLDKLSSGWWFQTPRRSCDVTVMDFVIFRMNFESRLSSYVAHKIVLWKSYRTILFIFARF